MSACCFTRSANDPASATASSRIVTKLVRGIYPGRNQRGVRQRTRVEIDPSFDTATASPGIDELAAKQAFVNSFKFVQVEERLLRILQDEKIAFDKSSWSCGGHI